MNILLNFPKFKRTFFCVDLFLGTIALATAWLIFYIILVSQFIELKIGLPNVNINLFEAITTGVSLILAIYQLPSVTQKHVLHLFYYLHIKLIWLFIVYTCLLISFVIEAHWADEIWIYIIWIFEVYGWLCVNSLYQTLIEN